MKSHNNTTKKSTSSHPSRRGNCTLNGRENRHWKWALRMFTQSSELEILVSGMITFSHSIGEKMKHRYQSFTRFGRQFQSLKRQVYAVWTSVSFPLCQRSCLIWRIIAKNDEYNDEYLCRDFFVGFNFWSNLSFQIPEFRVH